MTNDIDFEQLIDLLDRALTSKDPKVMKALKKFLFIAALATEDTETKGPFADLISRIERLEEQARTQGITTTTPYTPTWPGQGPYWVGGGTSTTSGGTSYYNFGDSTAGEFTTTPTITYTSSAKETLIDDTLASMDVLQKKATDDLQKD